ncbi:hypothetical protein BN946_scf184577.g1 [Trametes cinnabarina]|uniref:Uncharacterized protein n=1 Tax=Pycnoporus cinnabarinus TaxID=5643 RepID=A0A060SZF7_PYCCI|nr:hypothetical protein BN946_scf184577.g1 [Trametes cinnabarina]
MATAVDYSNVNKAYAHTQSQAKPTTPMPGEHLDVFPARLPRHCEPPLMSYTVENMWPPMYVLGWLYTSEEFEARLGQGDPMTVFKERIRRPFQAKFKGANVSSPSLDTTSGPCIVSVGSNSSVRSLARAHQENSIEATKALLGETAEPEWIRVPLAEMAGLF